MEHHGLNPFGEEQEGNLFIVFSGTRPLQKDLEKNLCTRGDKKAGKATRSVEGLAEKQRAGHLLSSNISLLSKAKLSQTSHAMFASVCFWICNLPFSCKKTAEECHWNHLKGSGVGGTLQMSTLDGSGGNPSSLSKKMQKFKWCFHKMKT